jgi:hypothetical protein
MKADSLNEPGYPGDRGGDELAKKVPFAEEAIDVPGFAQDEGYQRQFLLD